MAYEVLTHSQAAKKRFLCLPKIIGEQKYYIYRCSWTRDSRDRQSPPQWYPPPPHPPNLGEGDFPSSFLLSLLPFSFPSLFPFFPPSFEAVSAAHHHHRGRRCFASLLQLSKLHLCIEPFLLLHTLKLAFFCSYCRLEPVTVRVVCRKRGRRAFSVVGEPRIGAVGLSCS